MQIQQQLAFNLFKGWFAMKILKDIAPHFSSFLSLILLLSGLRVPAQAQQRIIIINADQPNIWTLEQAHYLLAQMHRRDLDLRAKSLEDLDPNEINGLRFDVMRMLVEFGASFNQADLATNRMFTQNQQFNSQRRQELTAQADGLRKQSLTLTGEIDELETKKADAQSDEEKARLDAKIASKKNVLARVDKEVENVDGELKTLNVAGGELKATTGAAEFDASKLPKSVFDKAFEAAATSQIQKFNDAPQLNAALRLDNFCRCSTRLLPNSSALSGTSWDLANAFCSSRCRKRSTSRITRLIKSGHSRGGRSQGTQSESVPPSTSRLPLLHPPRRGKIKHRLRHFRT